MIEVIFILIKWDWNFIMFQIVGEYFAQSAAHLIQGGNKIRPMQFKLNEDFRVWFNENLTEKVVRIGLVSKNLSPLKSKDGFNAADISGFLIVNLLIEAILQW